MEKIKTLYLPLKKEWYEMIDRGLKQEEYRGITAYWIVRLLINKNGLKISMYIATFLASNIAILKRCIESGKLVFRHFDCVKFSYGYTKKTMIVEVVSITIGKGKTEWGAPSDKEVFIIKLGMRERKVG